MKETHLFYTPDIVDGAGLLPETEASHAIRVLRMKEGDRLLLTDGCGHFHEAEITLASAKRCGFKILRSQKDRKLWKGGIHLAVAPTKNMDRMEWLTEKATEIGMDSLTLLHCKNSERHTVKTERLEKIAIAAMKQSQKAYKPAIVPLTDFMQFISQPFDGQRFIAHCHDAALPEVASDAHEVLPHLSVQNFLVDLLDKQSPSLVLIGPEGDFTPEEVEAAIRAGFKPVSLGESRLRTETAALAAVHMMYLTKRTPFT